MKKEDRQTENQTSTVIEDLTVSETETTNIKGGPMAQDQLLQIDGIKGESRERPTR